MGTRINVLFAHCLNDWKNRPETSAILADALPFDFAIDVFWDGGTVAECVSVRMNRVGPPRPISDARDLEIAEATRYGPPSVLYHEPL